MQELFILSRNMKGIGLSGDSLHILERETGVEPATLSLGIKLATVNSRAISATSTISGTVFRLARLSV
jgi:hypothetical protein